mmetsp:Transcript_7621/g.23547  ORF Transcript_7621/g.23547 Transcript_7621/m.23547 type:complete len:266 (+) Transcript_7621:89-886(+)
MKGGLLAVVEKGGDAAVQAGGLLDATGRAFAAAAGVRCDAREGHPPPPHARHVLQPVVVSPVVVASLLLRRRRGERVLLGLLVVGALYYVVFEEVFCEEPVGQVHGRNDAEPGTREAQRREATAPSQESVARDHGDHGPSFGAAADGRHDHVVRRFELTRLLAGEAHEHTFLNLDRARPRPVVDDEDDRPPGAAAGAADRNEVRFEPQRAAHVVDVHQDRRLSPPPVRQRRRTLLLLLLLFGEIDDRRALRCRQSDDEKCRRAHD